MSFFFHAPEKWGDRASVFGDTLLARTYRTLPWGYSLGGALLIWEHAAMAAYDSHLYWRTLGTALVFQGGISYLADVHDYGRRMEDSHWKRIDLILAPTLTFLASVALICRSWLGMMLLPARTINAWAIGCALAIGSKCMGARASHRPSTSIETIMHWHNAWHSLSWLATLLVWDLVRL